jgi:opacity protein-like surface antigen
MKKIYAAAMWGLILAPAHGFAADMAAFPADSAPAGQQLVEIGTGWYIRGDVGAALDPAPILTFNPNAFNAPPLSISPSYGASSNKLDFVAGLGVGYKFNNYFRADATVDYRGGNMNLNNTMGGIICPYTATGLTSPNQFDQFGNPLQLGYAYNTANSCNSLVQLKQQNYTGLVNGYVDLFTFAGVTPYVGAGAGLNTAFTTGSLTYATPLNGGSYRADLSPTGTFPLVWVNPASLSAVNPQPKIAFAPQNWDQSLKTTKYSLAIAFMGGVGIALTPHATLDLGYRYLNLGSTSYIENPQTGATLSQKNTSQEVRVGIRYQPD